MVAAYSNGFMTTYPHQLLLGKTTRSGRNFIPYLLH